MKTAIQCPHCEQRKVEVAKDFWFIYGFLIIARYGSKTIIGCQSCVQSKGIINLGLVALFGWWCFPWGLGTPFALLQNLVSLGTNNDKKLREVLHKVGVSAADVQVGEDGLTPEQRTLFAGVISILVEAIWADGDVDDREVQTAVQICADLLDGAVSEAELRRKIRDRQTAPLDASGLEPEHRLLLFHAAMAIVAADDKVEPGEARFLHDLGKRLALPREIVAQLLESLQNLQGGQTLASADPVLRLAYQILSAKPAQSAPDIKRRYRKLCMQYHPDKHSNVKGSQAMANECMAWLNWAYQTTLHGRSAGDPPGEHPPSALVA
jgi:DnaJ-domain-containing protein 1